LYKLAGNFLIHVLPRDDTPFHRCIHLLEDSLNNPRTSILHRSGAFSKSLPLNLLPTKILLDSLNSFLFRNSVVEREKCAMIEVRQGSLYQATEIKKEGWENAGTYL